MPLSYHLPDGYKENSNARQYVDHDDGVIWQVGAYRFGLDLCKEHNLRSVVDIGCGGARKLAWFAARGLQVVGYDIAHPTKHDWMEHRMIDLDKDDNIPLLEGVQTPALVVCADVVEHVKHPLWLLSKLIDLALAGNIVLLTTPDRELCHGKEHLGPPPNAAHVREWTLAEVHALIVDLVPESRRHDFEMECLHTQTTDKSIDKHTSTITMRRK